MRNAIFVREIYCANRNSDSETQSDSWVRKVFGTWDLIYAEHPRVQPRDRDCDPAVNPIFNVQNRFIHFRGHDLTQSGEYNLGLLTDNFIRREDRRRIFPLVMSVITVLVLLYFLSPRQQRIHSFWIPSLHVSISKHNFNNGFHMDLP